MKLIIFYTCLLLDEIEDSFINKDECCSVSVPEDLLETDFKNYVYKFYYDKIFDLEKNCCGSYTLYNLNINYIKVLTELNL